MVRIKTTAIALFLSAITLQGQYTDYIGAGQTEGVIVTTSSDYQPPNRNNIASGSKTIMGNGLDGKRIEASRFLSQATMGVDPSVIDHVAEIGIEAWIDEQMALSPSNYLGETQSVYQELYNVYLDNGGDPEEFRWRPAWNEFNYAWWHINMTNEDYLRQRVALALSEILVISFNSDLNSYGDGVSDYYNIFSTHAFGNYHDILREVTYHPTMGHYLSHLNNPKADPANNVHPDENYAREIMQLFTIGLYELNDDGSRQLDGNGDFIPTYGNEEVREFAKVFTGLGIGGVIPNEWTDEPNFGMGLWVADVTVPMVMYEEQHQQGAKTLFDGFVIPDGQSGEEDINQAVEHLFNHHNVGPFIGRQLIQRLVKSNPSPEYIARITAVFNDNGQGVRGDLGAVIKAILLDEEARSCEVMADMTHGKLREPILRYTDFARKIDKYSPSGKFWEVGYGFMENAGQHAMFSPSVFNFFLPDFQPIGPIAEQGLVAPEFQIHNTRTSLGYANEVHTWVVWEDLLGIWLEFDHEYNTYTDFSNLIEDAKDAEVLVNKLDMYFTNGQLTDRTRMIIKEAVETQPITLTGLLERINLAVYLIMISPDYVVFR